MSSNPQQLDGLDFIAKLVSDGQEPQITVRQLLGWFGARRRGWRVVRRINEALHQRNLITEPDFNEVWVDALLHVKRSNPMTPSESPASTIVVSNHQAQPVSEEESASQQSLSDPILRLGQLPAANQPVTWVSPGTSLQEAMTVMMLNDFSQLPIMQNARSCKGAISWQSIAVMTALGHQCKTVNECAISVDDVPILSARSSLLDAIPKIAVAGFALVRAQDSQIQGIVTAVDLSLQFRALSEPFLILGQIENLLRNLVIASFSLEDMNAAKNPTDLDRVISGVQDLTFGEYVRLMEPSEAWQKLKLPIDRTSFLKRLHDIRNLRNDVMHFDPDPLDSEDLTTLQRFVTFLEQLLRRKVG